MTAVGTARKVLLDHGVAVAAVAFAGYAAMTSSHVVDGDNAELAGLGTVGGAAHPTGYPAYLMWLRAWSWLPSASPAQTAALATALLAALGALVVHHAGRAWGARPVAAAIAAAIYAAGPEVVRVATEAEVFAMNQLVVAAIVWLAAPAGPLRGGWRTVALAAVAGVGLADHVTCVLAAPIGLYGAVLGVRERARARGVVVAAAVGAFAVGVSPYLYLLATAPNRLSWGDIDSLRALVRHVLREDYGGPGSFSPHGTPVPAADNLLAWAATVGRGWLYLPALAGVAWLVRACVRPTVTAAPGEPPRAAWWALAASLLLAGPLLAIRFDAPLDDLGLYTVRRFHLMSLVILAPAAARAIDVAVARLAREAVAWVAAGAALVGGLVAAAPHIAALHTPAFENAAANLLRSLPADAVLVQSHGERYFAIGYLQLARGLRPDVVIVDWAIIALPWYRARLEAEGITIPHGTDASAQVAAALLAQGRAVFVDDFGATIVEHLPTYPYGTVFRVLPAGTPRPSIEEVFAIEQRVFADFDLDYAPPGLHDEFATRAHEDYARAWDIVARALLADGRRDDAAAAAAVARGLGPQP
jgi:hypothetical protein